VSLPELLEYEYTRPPDLAALCALLAERAAHGQETALLAGGTDFFVERHIAPVADEDTPRPLVADVSRLEELRAIGIDGRVARIGAAATYLEIRRHPVLAERAPLLGAMSREVGAIQIQARGTLGGNLATGSPAADGVAALAALDADVVLRSARGERVVPIGAFYTGYRRTVRARDELILRVELALPAPGAVGCWRKVGTRSAQAISKVALAAIGEVERGRATRIGLGMASVAPTIAFLPTVRALLLSRPLVEVADADLDAATDADVAPIDDIRSTAAYRRHVARVLVRRFADALRAR
jgi:CO/xanthine dehydrogenase FAD-binding subunit